MTNDQWGGLWGILPRGGGSVNDLGVERLQTVHVLLYGYRRPDAGAQAGEEVGVIQQALFACVLKPGF